MPSPWDELGLEPTGDTAAIRRRYAARLKQCQPEDDPEAFMRLRAAYEAAMAMAAADADDDLLEMPAVVRRQPAPARSEDAAPGGSDPDDVGEEDTARRAIVAAIERRDIIATAEALAKARRGGGLSLADEMALTDHLLALLVFDRTLDVATIVTAATRLGWYGEEEPDQRLPLLAHLHARVAAEHWLVALRQQAASYRYYLGGHSAAAARLLLGRGRIVLSRLVPPEPPLRQFVAQFHYHRPWIGHAFDPRRIADLERIAGHSFTRASSTLWLVVLLVLAAIAGSRVSLVPGFALAAAWYLRRIARPILLGALILVPLAALPWWADQLWPSGQPFLVQTQPLPAVPRWAGQLGPSGQPDMVQGLQPLSALPQWAGQLGPSRLPDMLQRQPLSAPPQWVGQPRPSRQPDTLQALPPFVQLTRLAESGDQNAAFDLGVRYANGNGVAADGAAAARWFARALPTRPDAATWLGNLYGSGQGVPPDQAKARGYYQEGASRGDATAQANLAIMMTFGRGGPADPDGAFAWYLAAARRGIPSALNGVGYSYLAGHGVPQDSVRAVIWLRAAADAGQPNAMHTMAALFLRGEGTPASPTMAYYWLSLAVQTYAPADTMRSAAEAALSQTAALLSDEQKTMLDEDVALWRPQAGRAPE